MGKKYVISAILAAVALAITYELSHCNDYVCGPKYKHIENEVPNPQLPIPTTSATVVTSGTATNSDDIKALLKSIRATGLERNYH